MINYFMQVMYAPEGQSTCSCSSYLQAADCVHVALLNESDEGVLGGKPFPEVGAQVPLKTSSGEVVGHWVEGAFVYKNRQGRTTCSLDWTGLCAHILKVCPDINEAVVLEEEDAAVGDAALFVEEEEGDITADGAPEPGGFPACVFSLSRMV